MQRQFPQVKLYAADDELFSDDEMETPSRSTKSIQSAKVEMAIPSYPTKFIQFNKAKKPEVYTYCFKTDMVEKTVSFTDKILSGIDLEQYCGEADHNGSVEIATVNNYVLNLRSETFDNPVVMARQNVSDDNKTFGYTFGIIDDARYAREMILSNPIEKRLFHEVIFGEYGHKLYFDIDLPYDSLPQDQDFAEVESQLTNVFVKVFSYAIHKYMFEAGVSNIEHVRQIYVDFERDGKCRPFFPGAEAIEDELAQPINDDRKRQLQAEKSLAYLIQYYLFTAHRANKFSYTFVFPNIRVNGAINKHIAEIAKRTMTEESDPLVSFFGLTGPTVIDHNVYSRRHNYRCVDCVKDGKPETVRQLSYHGYDENPKPSDYFISTIRGGNWRVLNLAEDQLKGITEPTPQKEAETKPIADRNIPDMSYECIDELIECFEGHSFATKDWQPVGLSIRVQASKFTADQYKKLVNKFSWYDRRYAGSYEPFNSINNWKPERIYESMNVYYIMKRAKEFNSAKYDAWFAKYNSAMPVKPTQPTKSEDEQLAECLSTMDSWVPEYIKGDEIKADTVYEKEHMEPYPLVETLFIKANKGVGKTHSLCEFIKNNPDFKSIVVVSFRRSLCLHLHTVLNKSDLKFSKYNDPEIVKQPIIDAERIIVQVESIHKIDRDTVDLLVLDEVESILPQFNCVRTNKRNMTNNIRRIKHLISIAKHAIIMDANLSQTTITKINGLRHSLGTTKVIQNTFVRNASKYVIATDSMTMVKKAIDLVLAGKKLVIPCNRSISFMETLQAEITNACNKAGKPVPRVRLYNSNNVQLAEVKAELSNIEQSWLNYDVIIYSPTLQAGVSFDPPAAHFDNIVCFFVNNGMTVSSIDQMIERVRKTKDDTIYMSIKCIRSKGGSFQSRDSIIDYLRSMRSSLAQQYIPDNIQCEIDTTNKVNIMGLDSFEASLWLDHQLVLSRDNHEFYKRFISRLYLNGMRSDKCQVMAKSIGKEMSDLKSEFKEVEKAIKTKQCTDIATAQFISEAEVMEIEQQMQQEQQVSEDKVSAVKKHHLCKKLELPEAVSPSPDVVKNFGSRPISNTYKNFRLTGQAGEIEAKLNALRVEEKDGFDAFATRYQQMVNDDIHLLDEALAPTNPTSLVSAELNKKYTYKRLLYANMLTSLVGFKTIYDTETKVQEAAFNKAVDDVFKRKELGDILTVFKKDNKARTTTRSRLDLINSVVYEVYGMKFRKETKNSKFYTLQHEHLGAYYNLTQAEICYAVNANGEIANGICTKPAVFNSVVKSEG